MSKLLTLDSINDKVGVKNNSPTKTLDISSNLILNGMLGINNGSTIDYGNKDDILISNGSSSSVSWNSPYFLKVKLLNDDTGLSSDLNDDTTPTYYKIGSNSSAQLKKQFTGSDYSFTNVNNSHWNETNAEWTCPKTGIYKFITQISFSPTYNNDKIRFTSIYLNRTDVNGVSYIIDSNNYMAEGETTDTANPYTVKQIDNFLQTIALINQNEKVELRAQWEILDTTNMIIQGSSSNNSTFLIIERIM